MPPSPRNITHQPGAAFEHNRSSDDDGATSHARSRLLLEVAPPEELEALEAVGLAGSAAPRGHGRARLSRALAPSSLHRLEEARPLLDLRRVAVELAAGAAAEAEAVERADALEVKRVEVREDYDGARAFFRTRRVESFLGRGARAGRADALGELVGANDALAVEARDLLNGSMVRARACRAPARAMARSDRHRSARTVMFFQVLSAAWTGRPLHDSVTTA